MWLARISSKCMIGVWIWVNHPPRWFVPKIGVFGPGLARVWPLDGWQAFGGGTLGRRRCSSVRLCHHVKSRASFLIWFVLSFGKSSGCFEFSVVKWLALLVSWKLEFWRGAYHDAIAPPPVSAAAADILCGTVWFNWRNFTRERRYK